MEYRQQQQQHSVSDSQVKIQPRLIIHGGAGNILRSNFPADKYAAYRASLLSIVSFSPSLSKSTPIQHIYPCFHHRS